MIYQVAPIKEQTVALPKLNKALLQARHIQARVKHAGPQAEPPTYVELWSPHTAGPYIVPVTRWIE